MAVAGDACDPVAMTRQLDMVIVGAGFAGLYMLHEARTLGLETEVIEAGDGVGGTWYWNRYPGPGATPQHGIQLWLA